MISSHNAKRDEIEQPQDDLKSIPDSDQVHSASDQFLKYYRQFVGEPTCSEPLWRVPMTQKLDRIDRFRDLLAQAIAKLLKSF